MCMCEIIAAMSSVLHISFVISLSLAHQSRELIFVCIVLYLGVRDAKGKHKIY